MDPQVNGSDRLWAALAEPMRLRLLDLLLEREEVTASALARGLPISRQAIAKHLAVLERAGLVQAQRAGREVRFAICHDQLDEAQRQMAQVAARWDRRLGAIKRIAEAAHQAASAQGLPHHAFEGARRLVPPQSRDLGPP